MLEDASAASCFVQCPFPAFWRRSLPPAAKQSPKGQQQNCSLRSVLGRTRMSKGAKRREAPTQKCGLRALRVSLRLSDWWNTLRSQDSIKTFCHVLLCYGPYHQNPLFVSFVARDGSQTKRKVAATKQLWLVASRSTVFPHWHRQLVSSSNQLRWPCLPPQSLPKLSSSARFNQCMCWKMPLPCPALSRVLLLEPAFQR